jgi:hypothetical protein
MLYILLLLSGICSITEVIEQGYYVARKGRCDTAGIKVPLLSHVWKSGMGLEAIRREI